MPTPTTESKCSSASRIPAASKPPSTGKLSTVESWQTFETRIEGLPRAEQRYIRWQVLCWLWHEALIRADLTVEERRWHSWIIKRYRYRDHDYLIGLKDVPEYPAPIDNLPPHIKEAWAVKELYTEQAIDPDQNKLDLRIDLSIHHNVLLKAVDAIMKAARREKGIRRIAGSGKRYSLSRLVEALWLHDERRKQGHVKWAAVTHGSKTFSATGDRHTKIANLCSQMFKYAKLGQQEFVDKFF